MFLGDGVRSILDTRWPTNVHWRSPQDPLPEDDGPVMGYGLTILVASNVFGSEVIGSTPVLKIALPSSPLPEHRSDRIMRPF